MEFSEAMPEPDMTLYCNSCGKYFTTKFNLKRHKVKVHYPKVKKYLKHDKKGKKYQCKICKELFFPSARLKEHYLKVHTKHELSWNSVGLDSLARRKPIMPKEKMNQFSDDILSR